MQRKYPSLPVALLISVIVLLGSGCSPAAKRDRLLQTADEHYKAGDYDKAEVEYLNVLKAERGNPRAVVRLGLIYTEQGRIGPAISYLRGGHSLVPEDLDVRYRLGQIHLSTGNPKEAQTEAIYILEHRPLDPEAPLLLAATISGPTEIEPIRARLLALPAPAPTGAPVLVALAMIEARQSHLKECEALCRRALQANPGFAEAYTVLGMTQLAQKDTAGATESFKKSAELSPPRSPRRLQYAQFLIRSDNLAGGKQVIEEITRKTPDYLPAWIALAELALAENKYPECESLLDKALSRENNNLEALLLRGRLRLAQGRNADALAEFENLANKFPMVSAIQFELSRAQVANGDTGKAIANLSQLLTRAPNHAEATLLLANLHLRKGDASSSVAILKKLVQVRPDLIQASLLLAEAYSIQGNPDDALTIYRQIEEKFPQNTRTPLLRGIALAQQKNYAEARVAFERAHVLMPEEAQPLEQLVNLDLVEKKPEAALDRVMAETKRNPKQAGPGQLLLAKIHLAQKDLAAAETDLKKAIELMPDNPNTYLLLSGIYTSRNEIPKALAELEEAVRHNPKDATALMIIGLLHEQQKNYEAARTAYEKVLAVSPRASAAMNNLAYLEAERFGRMDRAQELAQKAVDLNPQDPHTKDTLGWILFRKKLYPRALLLLEDAVESMATSQEVQYHLGLTHYMMGDEQPARLALQRALQPAGDFPGRADAQKALDVLEIDTSQNDAATLARLEKITADRADDPVALARLAAFQLRAGQTDRAKTAFEAALKINDKNVNVLINLATLHAARKEPAKAMELAKAARKLAPDDATVALSLGKLAYQAGDYAWAASLLQESARKLTASPELLFDLAQAVYSIGRVDEAAEALRTALAPKTGTSLEIFTQANAARRFLELIELAANPAAARAQAARVTQILQAEPDYVPALMVAGAGSEQSGDTAGAKKNYEKALGHFPDFTPAKVRLAILGSRQAEFDQQAYDYAQQARTAFPNNPEIAKALGILTYRKGDHGRVVALLKESLATLKDDPEGWYYLGQAQFALKKPAESKASLQRAIELGLKGDQAKEAQRILAGLK